MIFSLSDDLVFPPVRLADPDGLLAVGGDLSPERLLAAYRHGIFPWFSEGDPILWWAPDPRFVLFPAEIKVSRSMRKVLRRGDFSITYDQAFAAVINRCRKARPGQDGTWITDAMVEAYTRLHALGVAHSVEAWHDGVLVGGLYGVRTGRMFCGESMFADETNASKAALITLAAQAPARGFDCIDCQVRSEHLASLGARAIPRTEFLRLLDNL